MPDLPYWTEERLARLSGEIDRFEAVLRQPGLTARQRKERLAFAARSCCDRDVVHLLGRDLDQPEQLERALIRARDHLETLRANHLESK